MTGLFRVEFSRSTEKWGVCSRDDSLIIAEYDTWEEAEADCIQRNQLANRLKKMLAPRQRTARIG